MSNLPEHLGGHLNVTHLDTVSLRYMIDTFNIKSFMDVGCGPGHMINCAIEQPEIKEAYGIDGDFTLERTDINGDVIIHDFTKGPIHPQRTDMAWSVEFLEHVDEEFVPHIFSAFSKANYVLCTAAPPGYPGHHHVNCREQSYWIDKFKEYGFEFLEKETNEIRRLSKMKRNFIRETGMIFKRIRKLHVGCGPKYLPGYEHNDVIDKPFIDHQCKAIDIDVPENTFEEIYARHWLEHLSKHEAEETITKFRSILSPGGCLYLIVPNLEFHAKQLLMPGKSNFVETSNFEHAIAGFYGWQDPERPYMAHRWGYTKSSIKTLLESTGFLDINILDCRECDIEVMCKK